MARQRSKWTWQTGPIGARVTACERTLGGNVQLLAYDRALGGYRKRSLGFPVRDVNGRLITEHVDRAREQAAELANRLIRGENPTAQVTLGALIDLFEREVVAVMTPRHQEDTMATEGEATRSHLVARGPRQGEARLAHSGAPRGPRRPGGAAPRAARGGRCAGVSVREGRDAAGGPPPRHTLAAPWHPFRRGWATSRKHLPLKDVAEAGGWKDTTTLVKCYQQVDPETLAAVVMNDRPVRAAR